MYIIFIYANNKIYLQKLIVNLKINLFEPWMGNIMKKKLSI